MDNKDFILKVPTFLKFRDELDQKDTAITITEAEFISDQVAELNKVSTYGDDIPFEFYTTYVSVVDKNGSGKRIQSGVPGITEEQLNATLEELETNCRNTTLEAYLREAIKKFNEMKNVISNYSLDQYIKFKNYNLNNVSNDKVVNFNDDVLFNQDLGVISDYFKFQTYASYYGSNVLHRYGTLNQARINYMTKLKSGNHIDQVGNELLMTEFVPTIDKDKLDDIFFKVQGTQRNYQVKYNGLNKKLNDQLSDLIRKNNETAKELADEYSSKMKKIRIEFDQWRNDQLSLLGKLKIVIPHAFIDIYNNIKSKLAE